MIFTSIFYFKCLYEVVNDYETLLKNSNQNWHEELLFVILFEIFVAKYSLGRFDVAIQTNKARVTIFLYEIGGLKWFICIYYFYKF